ncbi:kinase-like protein [Dothidotthia symphoricarpi CBS 119687]|uniref:Kinase-like protein n=1 Tax=Dothidotthia symphoricarpi CBS 119687 TaxID=1392245 RepID=A0A6A6A2I4_9PLEO|nr:kinase-like protein [Dothidotthia symphoricarpi CBS 119687]KAF2125384.1 kinase-like protein [Dothidotthia symphoricarpi CBS 119687]
MALRIGQILRGAKGNYELLRSLKGSTVFKARVLSGSSTQAKWAIIKSAATESERMCLRREHRNYKIDKIASSPYIRALYDTIQLDTSQDDTVHLSTSRDNASCLVFEWMDHDLRAVTAPEFRSDSKLPKAVCHGVLSALDVLKTLDAVHTDISPNNIFISDIDGRQPVAKLGDLGNSKLIRDSSATQRAQCLPCRAPEVWRGQSCRHASDIWSLAVTLTTKLSPLGLFGTGDKIIEGHAEAWCIAKIICLVGPLGLPVNRQFKEEFEFAAKLAVMNHPSGIMKLIDRLNWREELQHIPDPPVPSDVMDFIESLLVIDPEKRPTASDALLHPYLQPTA